MKKVKLLVLWVKDTDGELWFTEFVDSKSALAEVREIKKLGWKFYSLDIYLEEVK